MIPAVILAAGRSIRMGTAKPLLPASPGGPTFVRQIAIVLIDSGATDVLVVGRPTDSALINEVQTLGARVRYVTNAHADEGQLSSVIAGLDAADAPDVRGLLVTPVDAPLVRAATVRTLFAAFAAGDALVVRPAYRGRHGHPVIFARVLFDELRRADPERGAKAVVHAHHDALLNVDVDDPGVVDDIDRPEDYRGYLRVGRQLTTND